MRKAIYPGTFDPMTNGHLDLIKRTLNLFDELIIAIAENPSKKSLFSKKERLEMVRASVGNLRRVKVVLFSGLLADLTKKLGAVAIIRGVRAVSDFDYEFQLALTNRKIAPKTETVFLMPSEKYSYLNSTLIKDIAKWNGDTSKFVPPLVVKRLKEKFGY
jgi:pantetheine-phosphate adenylyltransferase